MVESTSTSFASVVTSSARIAIFRICRLKKLKRRSFGTT